MVFLWALALAAAAQSPATGPPPQSGGFVGSNVCKTCHPDVWLNFYKNPHYKGLASGKETPERTGCEGCHGPAKGHVDARGGRTTIPRAFSLMTPARVLETCLECHSKDLSRAEIRRSAHTQADIACNRCHSIHKPSVPKALLANSPTPLCYGCHGNVRAQFSMPFKHRVNEGTVACTDCHNPHGTAAATWRMGPHPRMTAAAADGEQACLRCHTDKRGPFVFEHAGIRVDGCESCHSPHGSANPRLLKRPAVMMLCLECHSGSGSFGRQADGIRIQSSTHNMAEPRYQNCTACHVRIHGSNSDQRFLR